MGKGSKRRPTQVTREQNDLNWLLALKKITFAEYTNRRTELIKRGKWGLKR
jgi:hypothetical protein